MTLDCDFIEDIQPCSIPKRPMMLFGKYKLSGWDCYINYDENYYQEERELRFEISNDELQKIKYSKLTPKQEQIYARLPKAAKILAFGGQYKNGVSSLNKMLEDLFGKDVSLYYDAYNINFNPKKIKHKVSMSDFMDFEPRLFVEIYDFDLDMLDKLIQF